MVEFNKNRNRSFATGEKCINTAIKTNNRNFINEIWLLIEANREIVSRFYGVWYIFSYISNTIIFNNILIYEWFKEMGRMKRLSKKKEKRKRKQGKLTDEQRIKR